MRRRWIWWTAFVSAIVLVAQVPAQAVDETPTATSVPTTVADASDASDSEPACAAKTLSDPAVWEQALPVAKVSSDMTASDPGCVREVGRTADRVVWRNPDGSLTARTYASPVNFKAPDGSWQPVDTRLKADGEGGTVNRGGPLGVHFAADASAAELVRVEVPDGSVSFRLRGAATTDDAVIAPSPQASGVVGGDGSDTITYASALPNIDVRYEMLASALKEEIVLNKPLAKGTLPEFRFAVTTKGLSTRTADAGTIEFANAAGAVVLGIPAGQASDASGESTGVEYALAASADPDVSELVVSVDKKWLSDPNRQFPVTIDPTVTVTTGYDADIASLHGDTNYCCWSLWNLDWSPPTFRLNTGWYANETFYGLQPFDLSGLTGASISSAVWHGYAYAINVTPPATSVAVTLKPISESWNRTTVTWNNQPAVRTNASGSAGFTAGSWKTVGIKAWVQNWVSGTWANYGVELRGPITNDRRVQIAAAIEHPEYFSYLEITYDAIPTLSNFSAGGQYAQGSVQETQPTLSATISDADNATGLSGNFQLWNNATCTGSVLQSGTEPGVSSGQDAQWPLSSAVSPGTYSWKVNGTDGIATSAWSACQSLVIDTTAPNTPTASITGVTANTWKTAGGSSATANFGGNGSTDVYGFQWGLDVGSNPTTVAPATANAASVTINPTWGWHDLAVRAIDQAGNLSSSVAHFTFGWGSGGFAKPLPNLTTQQRVVAQVNTTTSFTGISMQWRRSDAQQWADISPGNVTYPCGQNTCTVISWPLAVTSGNYLSASPTLTWDAASTASGVDGPLQLRAGFYQSGNYTYLDDASIQHVTLNQTAFGGEGYASAPAGPGQVNLITGNLELSAHDVSLPVGAVSRTLQSRAPNATGSVFGPGWSSSIGGASLFHSLVDNGNTVIVTASDGTEISFAKNSDGSYASPPEGLELALTLVSSTRFTLQLGGTATVGFTNYDNNATNMFKPSDMTDDATGQTSSTTWQIVGGLTQPTRMTAPPPDGVDCSTAPLTTPGCQTVEFDYTPATPTWTETTLCGSGLGDYAGRLRFVKYTAWDPHKPGQAGMSDPPVNVATYCYDSTGHLRAAWDPRVSPALKVQYSYNADGQVATLTPPGQNPWNFTYAPLSGEATGTGRLSTVYRAQLSPLGNATTTFAYRIPLTTAAFGAYDLDATTIARWGQHDLPTDATAVFPPSQIPSGSPPSSYTAATVFYMNVDGELVNEARPGGYISTTEHDSVGKVIRRLSAANRKEALDSSGNPAAQATEAGLLDHQGIYDSTGVKLVDSYGPAHMVTLPDATRRLARAHAHFVYDEGAPGGETFNLVTAQTESAKPIDGSAEQSGQTTTYDYTVGTDASGWDLGTPLQTTVDDGTGSHLNLKTRNFYDITTGQLTERWLPKATDSGTPPGDVDKYKTQFVYYTAGTTTPTSCGGKPEWSGLLCFTKPAAQPGTPGLPDLATSQVTAYNMYGQPEAITDTNSSNNRTTTIDYDPAGRQTSLHVTGTSGAGTAMPAVTSAYGTTTGLHTTTADGARTITRVYDALGRLESYQDADANTSTYTYDLLGRIKTLNDGKGTATYTYGDSGSEARGLPTTIDYGSGIGNFTATYDADGNLATQTSPGSFTATYTRDEVGEVTDLAYTKGSSWWPTSTAQYDIHGRQTHATAALSLYNYSYDDAGRLTQATNVGELFSCPEQRTYQFDADSNRTLLQNTDGCAGAQTTTSTFSSYDAADRKIGGYSYDAFGRTTAVPASDTPTGAATTLTYYANDLVRTIVKGSTATHNLDPNERLRTFINSSDNKTHTNHYVSDTDSPSWTDEWTGGTSTWTRYLQGFNGMAAVVKETGTITIQFINTHGDVFNTVASTATDVTDTSYRGTWTDEFGVPLGSTARYDYLGTHQRKRDSNSGLQLMGVRVYNPATGRFLQTDPVLGGSANNYDYVSGDPVNNTDLGGDICQQGPPSANPVALRTYRYCPPRRPPPTKEYSFSCNTFFQTCTAIVGKSATRGLARLALYMYQQGVAISTIFSTLVDRVICQRAGIPGCRAFFSDAQRRGLRGQGLEFALALILAAFTESCLGLELRVSYGWGGVYVKGYFVVIGGRRCRDYYY
jgi:RHS repeat-associated protein